MEKSGATYISCVQGEHKYLLLKILYLRSHKKNQHLLNDGEGWQNSKVLSAVF